MIRARRRDPTAKSPDPRRRDLLPTAAAAGPVLLLAISCAVHPGLQTRPASLVGALPSPGSYALQEDPPGEPNPGDETDRGGGDEWEEEWGEEDWDEEEESGRSFLFLELVATGFYAPEGVNNVPPDDRKTDYVEFSPRPPGNYVGADYVRTFTSSSWWNKRLLPGWLPLTAVDLHPRVVFDRMEESDNPDQFKFAPQDFWARFNPWGVDRLSFRVGQFVIPFGVDPILAPRQRFILPVEATDLGLKWDWGVDLRGPIGDYDWEVAATIGTGEALHGNHPFAEKDLQSYLFTGRVGSPTYWDFRSGLSFLYGDVPFMRGPALIHTNPVSRWRVGWDSSYKYGTYLMTGAQVTFGQDGFLGDTEFAPLTGDDTADVLGYRFWLDWVVPWHHDLRLAGQFESVWRNLRKSESDDTAVILEAGYSVTTSITVRLDYRIEINRPVGKRYDALFFSFIFYM